MEYIKVTKVIKNGTSLGIVIPKSILTALDISRGDAIAWLVPSGGLLIAKPLKEIDIQNLKAPKI